MIYKFKGKARHGIGYDGGNGGFELFIQIPLLPWFRKEYENFETRDIRSGKAVVCVQWYLRRRDNEVFKTVKEYDCRRWITHLPGFYLKSVGKQKILVPRRERREVA